MVVARVTPSAEMYRFALALSAVFPLPNRSYDTGPALESSRTTPPVQFARSRFGSLTASLSFVAEGKIPSHTKGVKRAPPKNKP
jgi:hypothetical protein